MFTRKVCLLKFWVKGIGINLEHLSRAKNVFEIAKYFPLRPLTKDKDVECFLLYLKVVL